MLNTLLEKFEISLVRTFPRHSTRFAKKYFRNKKITALEVGTYRGLNAKNLFKELNLKLLYIVDPWEENESYLKNNPHAIQDTLNKAEQETDKRLKGKPIKKIKKYSDDALKDVPESVDFIYIDGDHSYKQSKKDMINYWEKLKKGGIMGGHDICNPWDNYGVARAFMEFCFENKLKPKISRTDWWVIKEIRNNRKTKNNEIHY